MPAPSVHLAFPEPVLTRLRRLKAEWDPYEVFNQNFNIPPTP
jgi:FAD/FMN-containing dehydrogenase